MQKSYVASGNVYGAMLDASRQLISGYDDFGEAWPLTCEAKTKQKKQKSARRGMRGQIVNSGISIDSVEGTLKVRNWNAKNIARMASGKLIELTGDAGSATNQALTLPADGSWVPVGHQNISAVTIADKEEGTDFEVNPRLGMLRSLGGELAVEVSYSFAAEKGYKIEVANQGAIRMALMIDGQNDETGEPFVAIFDSVVLIPKSPLTLISDPETDYEEMEFDLIFETLPGKTSPGTINGFAL